MSSFGWVFATLSGGSDTVTPPAATSETVAAGGSPAPKTFGAFTDAGGEIDSYSATILAVVGSGTLSGTGLGAYTISGAVEGDTYSILLTALNSSSQALATAVHTVEMASVRDVIAPAPTNEVVAAGAAPAAKTFGAFTDPDGAIDNYLATLVNVQGSASMTGSGLGPYTVTGTAASNSYFIKLEARDSGSTTLATAVHVVGIGAVPAAVIAPAPTSESVSAGGTPAAKTFGAFTDPDGRINSYSYYLTSIVGSGTASGSGLGPYTFSGTADGDCYVLMLTAEDLVPDDLAVAVHTIGIGHTAGGGGNVLAPSPTTEAVASGNAPSAKTFGAFIDPSSEISAYNSTLITIAGSGTLSGTGLGPYTISGHADGDIYVIVLEAEDGIPVPLARTTHTIGIQSSGGGGGGALDPDTNVNSIASTNESNAVTGWSPGTVAFRGPSAAAGATIGGSDASKFVLSGGANGTITLAAGVGLTAAGGSGTNGEYEITLSVDNEGLGGFTTSTIQVTVLPDTSSLIQISTSDGWVYWRHGGGSWNVDQVWASADIQGIGGWEDATNGAQAILTRFNQTAGGDVRYSDDLITPTWGSAVNTGGTSFSSQKIFIDTVNSLAVTGNNNGRICFKDLATITADGSFTGFSTGRMKSNGGADWSGSGFEFVSAYHAYPDGDAIAVGYSWNGGSGQTHLSRTTDVLGSQWNEISIGSWTVGLPQSITVNGSTTLVGGTSGSLGVVAFSTDDGLTFDTTNTVADEVYSSACKPDGSIWVVGCDGGAIYTSPDPTAGVWTSRTSGTSELLRGCIWDEGASEFLMIGSTVVLSSSDGITWSTETLPSGTSANYRDISSNITSAPV